MFKWLFIFFIFGNGEVTSLSPFEFYNHLNSKSDVLLLDVRIQADYHSGHIERAQWAGTSIVLDSLLVHCTNNESVFIYCDYGQRTKSVIKLLKKRGYKHIVELKGGLDLWKEQGFPLTDN